MEPFHSNCARWAFNTSTWEPSEQDWLFASRCIQQEDKDRIHKFVFKTDAKASMAGCLMIRKFTHLATGEPYGKINIVRNEVGRPYMKQEKVSIDFNVSHQGNYTVLAGEIKNNFSVGVDIMNFQQKTRNELSELFRLMNSSFAKEEWNTILANDSEDKQSSMFFRHWSLKESYVKAIGVGICTDLRRISFKVKTPSLSIDKPCTDTTVQVDGVNDPNWQFHEWLLDPKHCVSVALSSGSNASPTDPPVPFTVLTWADLVREADPFLPPDLNYCKSFMQKDEKGAVHCT